MKALHIFSIASTPHSFFDGQFGYLVKKGHEIDVVASYDDMADFCTNNNVRFFPVEIARRIDIATDLKSIKSVLKLIKKGKYEAVFGHTPKGALIAMIAAKLAGVKTRVYYRHGLIYTTAEGVKRLLFKAVEKLTSALATHIINVSPSLGALAIRDGLNSAKKQHLIGSGTCGGIDAINVFNPSLMEKDKLESLKNNLNLQDSDFIIGFCGRICKEKGIRELVDGFKIFKQIHPEVKPKLLLVGYYDKRDVLPEAYKTIIESDKDIVKIGKVPQKELPYYYSLMDVFVFPSYREGFGMCVIEAAAMEVPALVSRSHGCVDSIKENITGQYIDINEDDIAKKLGTMLNNIDKRKMLGKQARDIVLKDYDWTILWPEINKFYNAINS